MAGFDKRVSLESALVASLIKSSTIDKDITDNDLHEDLFTLHPLKQIFLAIKELGENANLVTVHARLSAQAQSKLNEITMDSDRMFDSRGIKAIASELIRLDKIEKLRELVLSLDNVPVDEVIGKINNLSSQVITERLSERADDVARRVYTRLETASKEPDTIQGVRSGIDALDNYTWGFQKGKVYIIAGRPGMGKSACCMNIAKSAMLNKKRVYIQALEEGNESFVTRLLSSLSGLNNEALNKARINPSDWDKISNGIGQINGDYIIINDSTGLSADKISRLMKDEHNKTPLDLVIVDHLQEIVDKSAESRRLEVSMSASKLRGIAKALDIPIIIVSQLSRAVEGRADKTPMLSDLRESGDLEAIADVVIMLYRESYYTGLQNGDITFIIAKHRNGRTGRINAKIEMETLTITGGW